MATATTLTMLAWLASGLSSDFMEDPKFTYRSEIVLGLNTEELRDALGSPEEIGSGSCALPLVQPDESIELVSGNAWNYQHKTENSVTLLMVCVLDNHAVGQHLQVAVNEGSQVKMRSDTIFDMELIEKAFKGELDKRSQKERDVPEFSGPRFEI